MKTNNRRGPLPITPDEYLSFLSDLKIQGVGLDSASATIDRLILAEALASQSNVTFSLDAKFAVLERGSTFLRTSAQFEVFQCEENKEQKLVSISCAFSALFATTKTPSLEMSERFAQNESRVIFWPYLRHFVSDTSYRMAINPILVPLTSEFEAAGSSKRKMKSKHLKTPRAISTPK